MKARNADAMRAALDAPPADTRFYLLHGPDEAGAAELAGRLARAMGAAAERVDIDPASLKNDPARLADEAASLSLFGGARHIRVAGAGEESVEAVTALLAAERAGNPVVAIAPGLKTTSKLVKLAIDSPRALSFACYPPSAADAERIATAIARENGLRLASGVAARIATAAGGDRAVMTREIEKLALYLDAAPDRPRDLDDDALDAVGADLGEADTGLAVDALIEGESARLGAELARLTETGVSPIPWLRAMARKLMALAEMRASIDRGDSVDSVMKRGRINFREEAATARALRRWSPAMIARALSRVREAERAVMAPANAGSVLAESTITGMAQAIERRR